MLCWWTLMAINPISLVKCFKKSKQIYRIKKVWNTLVKYNLLEKLSLFIFYFFSAIPELESSEVLPGKTVFVFSSENQLFYFQYNSWPYNNYFYHCNSYFAPYLFSGSFILLITCSGLSETRAKPHMFINNNKLMN